MPVIGAMNNTQPWNGWGRKYELNIAKIVKGYLHFIMYGQYYVTDSITSRVRIMLAR